MEIITRRLILLGSLLIGGCDPSDETQTVTKKINIEVTGTPECLGQLVKPMADKGVGVAVLPKWSRGIGSMEMGPVETSHYGEIAKSLRLAECVEAVRARPCATPNSDLQVC